MRRFGFTGKQRGYHSSGTYNISGGFLLHRILDSKAGELVETGNKPKGPQLLGFNPNIKDGGYSHPKMLVLNDWLPKLVLLLHCPNSWDHQKHLRFIVAQVQYQFTSLLFGLSGASLIFTKVLQPVAVMITRTKYVYHIKSIPLHHTLITITMYVTSPLQDHKNYYDI